MKTKTKIKFAVAFLLAGGMGLLAGCSGFQVLNASGSRACTRTADIAYGNETRQKLDVYQPKNSGTNAKVVVFFYGGAWRSGKKADYRFVAQALAARGFVVVLPDYRLFPEVIFPAFVQDGAAAVRWTGDNISRFGGDTNRIYLMGHSAGAHIAALLTLDGHYLKDAGSDRKVIRATAALSGPYDFVPNTKDRAVFGLATNDTTIDPRIKPVHFVDGKAPPMLLIQGLKDKTVNPANTTSLASHIREAGGDVETILYPQRAHATVVMAFAPGFRWLAPVLDDVVDFF